jgi:hypothetical protein
VDVSLFRKKSATKKVPRIFVELGVRREKKENGGCRHIIPTDTKNNICCKKSARRAQTLAFSFQILFFVVGDFVENTFLKKWKA